MATRLACLSPSPKAENSSHRRQVVATGLALVGALMAQPGESVAQGSGAPTGQTTTLKRLSLEELGQVEVVVFGASQHNQRISEAPSSVTVITSDEIRRYGFRTLSDVLNSVSGFHARDDRNFHTMSIRGFGPPNDFNTRFLVLIDNHRDNEAVGDRALIGVQFLLDVDLIDRIEIVRGPGASLYGSNALLGVINVITRKGRDIDGVETMATLGSADSYKGRVTYGKQFENGAEVVVSGDYFRSAGRDRLYFPEFDDPATNDGVAEQADFGAFKHLFATATWKHWTVQTASVWPTKHIPTASYGTLFNDSRAETRDRRSYVDARYDRALSSGLNVMVRGAYDHRMTTGIYPYAGEDEGTSVINVDELSGQWLTGEVQLRRKWLTRHTLTGGALLIEHLDRTLINRDIDPAFVYLNERHRGRQVGIYLQNEYQPVQKLIVNAGLRYDWFSTFGPTANPRVGVIYSPVAPTALKLLYGTAFRAPSPEELYYHDGGVSQVASPELEPERITTFEVVLEQRLGPGARATVSRYRYHMNGLIQEGNSGDSTLIKLANLGGAEADGVELGLEGKARSLQGRASFSWQHGRNTETGERLTNSPQRLFKLNLIAPLDRRGTFVGLDTQYTSARRTLAGGFADGFTVVNATVSRREVLRGFDVAATLYNAFDRSFFAAGGPEHLQDLIPQDGRSLRVQFTRRFSSAPRTPSQ